MIAVTVRQKLNVPENREVTVRLPSSVPIGEAEYDITVQTPPVLNATTDATKALLENRPAGRNCFNPKLAQEELAFQKMLPELLSHYRDRYVAIHEGQIVVVGNSQIRVLNDAMSLYPGCLVHVRFVTDQPERIERLSTRMSMREIQKNI